MQDSIIEGLDWPHQARLAVCVIVAGFNSANDANAVGMDSLQHRLLDFLRERAVPAGLVGDFGTQLQQGREASSFQMLSRYAGEPSNNDIVAAGESTSGAGSQQWELALGHAAEPRWIEDNGRNRLLIPLDRQCSDSQMLQPPWWTPDEWLQYAMDSFDCLHQEAEHRPRVFGLHLTPLASGRSGTIQALGQLLGYIHERESVWLAGVSDIAQHCLQLQATAKGTKA